MTALMKFLYELEKYYVKMVVLNQLKQLYLMSFLEDLEVLFRKVSTSLINNTF